MVTFHQACQKSVRTADVSAFRELALQSIWVDLHEPTREEELVVEQVLGLSIPSRQEMQEIELSRRLYRESGADFMTATVLIGASSRQPASSAISFIWTPERLVTLRYADPFPFRVFNARMEAASCDMQTSHEVLAGLVDAIVERLADLLEGSGAALDQLSLEIFGGEAGELERGLPLPGAAPSPELPEQQDFNEILRRIGRVSDVVSRARESLVSMTRLVSFFRARHREDPAMQETLAHLNTVSADLTSLVDHATFLAGKVSFTLDATLGQINNEQNRIVKIMSVAAVVFLPPTLVASIYGMNFEVMPELKWAVGYPFALVLMVISAVLPYLLFKRKGWL